MSGKYDTPSWQMTKYFTFFFASTLTVSLLAYYAYSFGSYGEVIPIEQNCVFDNSTCVSETAICANDTSQWWGQAVNCNCSQYTIGNNCQYCRFPSTPTGIPSHRQIDGVVVARWGMAVGVYAVSVAAFTAVAWFWYHFRNANAALSTHEMYAIMKEVGGKNPGNLNSHVTALAPPAVETHSIEPYSLFALFLVTGYLLLLASTHTPTMYNYGVSVYINGGILTSQTDCGGYSQYMFLGMAFIFIAFEIVITSAWETAQIHTQINTDAKLRAFVTQVKRARGFNYAGWIGCVLGGAVAVSALIKVIWQGYHADRNCCNPLWTADQQDYTFNMILAVMWLLQLTQAALFMLYYYLLLPCTGGGSIMASKDSYTRIHNVQLFGSCAEHSDDGGIFDFFFNLPVYLIWFFLQFLGLVGFVALLWMDTQAFNKGNVFLYETLMKGNIILLISIVMIGFRMLVYYPCQASYDCLNGGGDCSGHTHTAGDLEKMHGSIVTLLATLEAAKDREGNELKDAAAKKDSLTADVQLMASISGVVATQPLVSNSWRIVSSRKWRRYVRTHMSVDEEGVGVPMQQRKNEAVESDEAPPQRRYDKTVPPSYW